MINLNKNNLEKKNKKYTCEVKNCQKIISEGEGIKIGNNLFCAQCGAIIIRDIFKLI